MSCDLTMKLPLKSIDLGSNNTLKKLPCLLVRWLISEMIVKIIFIIVINGYEIKDYCSNKSCKLDYLMDKLHINQLNSLHNTLNGMK